MALRGTLTSGGLSEVLQLVALQQRPGAIRFMNGADEIHVYVKDRHIVGIDQPARPANPAMGPETLELNARETLHALFDWSSGEYVFDVSEVSANVLTPQPIEAVLLEGARRMQLWPIIREKLPSFEETFERIREAPGADDEEVLGDDDNLDFESLADPNNDPTAFDRLDARTVRVDRLVQPGRTVREIIALSRIGTFETCRALSSLITGGYIRVKAPAVPRTFNTPLYASILLLVLATALMLIEGSSPETITLEQYRASTQKQVLRRGLELYKLQTGSYPHALEQLVEAGILRPRDLSYPYAQPYQLSFTPEGQPAISQ